MKIHRLRPCVRHRVVTGDLGPTLSPEVQQGSWTVRSLRQEDWRSIAGVGGAGSVEQ